MAAIQLPSPSPAPIPDKATNFFKLLMKEKAITTPPLNPDTQLANGKNACEWRCIDTEGRTEARAPYSRDYKLALNFDLPHHTTPNTMSRLVALSRSLGTDLDFLKFRVDLETCTLTLCALPQDFFLSTQGSKQPTIDVTKVEDFVCTINKVQEVLAAAHAEQAADISKLAPAGGTHRRQRHHH